MIKKFLSTVLTLSVAAVMAYFIFLSARTTSVPIEKSANGQDPLSEERLQGEKVYYRSFDAQGRELVSATSQKVTQINDVHYQLEEGVEFQHVDGDRRYRVSADSFQNEPNGRQVMSAPEGGSIVLKGDDGLSLITKGPLIHTADGVFETDERVQFTIGAIQGVCRGLRYLPDAFLELRREVEFNTRQNDHDLQITAASLSLDQPSQSGRIRDGIITSLFTADNSRTVLSAQEIGLLFKGGFSGGPFRMTQAELEGKTELPHFAWSRGELHSKTFLACFAASGQWVEELITEKRVTFQMQSEEGYGMEGQTGRLTLRMQREEPLQLVSQGALVLTARRGDEPELKLTGQKGMATEFADGNARSTRIFGTPTFHYGVRRAEAGSLRLLHDEGEVLLGEGAHFWDQEQDVHLSGDKILLIGWNRRDREIFAFDFVEIFYRETSPEKVHGTGERLKMKLPDNTVELEGKPARVERLGQTVEANQIELWGQEEESLEISTGDRVSLTMPGEGGLYRIEAETMNYNDQSRIISLERVRRASFPERGELSCQQLEIVLKKRTGEHGAQARIDHLTATRDVLFKGNLLEKGQAKPFSCRADILNYKAGEELIHFLGKGKDVSFKSATRVINGRQLTYNLNDDTIRLDSVAHGTTKTKVTQR